MQPNTLTTEVLIERLRDADMRVTPQRLAVYEELAQSPDHPTAQDLFERLQPRVPSLSQATVYNTLQALADIRLVQTREGTLDGVARYDANIGPHAHLVCTRCDRMDDFADVPPQTWDRHAAERTGFQIQTVSLTYYGRCPDCARLQQAPQSHKSYTPDGERK